MSHEPSEADTPPAILYHYTDAKGALGILQSRAFWATDARHLNDTTEHAYGLAHLRQLIDTTLHNGDADDPERRRIFDAMERGLERHADRTAYVVALSAEQDLYSQWEAYGDRGAGVALGFDGRALAKLPLAGGRLLRCEYDHGSDQWRLSSDAVRASGETYYSALRADQSLATALAMVETAMEDGARWVLNRLKHRGFRSEYEWRIIVPSDPTPFVTPTTRTTGTGETPYLEVPLSTEGIPFPVRSIQLGPYFANGTARDELEAWCKIQPKKSLRLTESNVPLRRRQGCP